MGERAIERRRGKTKPNGGTEWVGGALALPTYVTGEGDAPYRPETLLWVDLGGLVLGTAMFRPGELAGRIGEAFRETTRAPAVGAPHVPARVRIASPELAEALRREIGPATEVVCAPTPELDEVFASLADHLNGAGDATPTYLTAGITEDAVAGLFRAASRVYRAQPWRAFPSDTTLLSVSIPELDVEDAVLSVIGQMEKSFGMLLFSDEDSFERYLDMAELVATGEVAEPIVPPHLGLSFERRAEIGPELTEEVAEHGWEIAGPAAYPAPMAVDDDGLPRPPTARELAALEAVAHSIAELVTSTPRLARMLENDEPIDAEWTVETSRGPVRVRLASNEDKNPYADAAFDIHEDLYDFGEIDEARAHDFEEELVRRFVASQEVAGLEPAAYWAGALLQLARTQHGVTVKDLSRDIVKEVVFVDIPRKVSCDADAAAGIVAALRAFFAFLGRAFSLADVAPCADVLGPGAEAKLRARLSDPRNFGMAKSFVMSAKAAGHDMTSEAGIAAMLASRNVPTLGGLGPRSSGARGPKADPAKKGKRKAARAGRRKNRR